MRTVAYSGIFLATGFASALAADPTGDWRVADGVANIRVAECNGSMWGVVAWEKTPGGRDKNNPDVSKQNRPILGMPILIDMKKRPSVDLGGGETWTRVAGPIPSSPANSMAKGAPKTAGALPRTAAPTTGAAPPKTTGSIKPVAKTSGQKQSSADPVGDICLLPDIARFSH